MVKRSGIKSISSTSKLISKDYDLSKSEEFTLSQILNRLYRGNTEGPAIVSPYAERVEPEVIVQRFDVIFEANKSKLNSTLLSYELSQKEKIGSRSIAKPWSDIKENFLEYFDPEKNIKIPEAQKPEQLGRLRPVSLTTVVNNVKNSTSSGLPNLVKKGSIKERFLDPKYLNDELAKFYPSVPFIRTQERGKTRVVWGIPISQIINEGQIFYPLLAYQKKLKWRSALLGPSQVDSTIVDLVRKTVGKSGYLISIDFSAYDTTVKRTLITKCFEYIKALFQPSYSELIDGIRESFITVKMVTPDGLISGDHGIPSGSYFTNEVGSLCQYIIAKDSGLSSDFQVQGDDGVYSCFDEGQAKSLINYFSLFGLNVNKDKSYLSDSYCIYLQKLYHIDYINEGVLGGIYPVYRALNRIMYQERFVDFLDYGLVGQDYYSIRTISILENCKFHPLFEDLVKFVLSLDKYKLKYSETSLAKYVEMLTKVEGSEGLIINQYSDDVRGIANFDTTKLIKSLV